ncbi:MAG: DUF5596 domain-containing protein, partial [Candidatus Latescibacteria bacterium]|nr:DUF5596 domain-containing protein [Candidatus Latescibacterota bacterium]
QTKAIQEYGEWATFPQGAIDFTIQAAQKIAPDPDLAQLAWHAHNILFINKSANRSSTRDWPLLAPLLNEYGGAFYLLIALSGIPTIRAIHKSRNVPDDIAKLTYRDTYVWAQQYYDIGIPIDGKFTHPDKPNAWGLCTRIFPWILSHLHGDLYRVGRLQFKTGPYRQQMRAYRHRQTGDMRLIAESGLEFRPGGNFNGAGGITDSKAWTSHFTESNTEVTGNLIHPNGHAIQDPITLQLSDWESVVQQGDTILEIHIPEDGPMGFDACGESLRQAAAFFSKHFPDRPFKAICCTSWLLDPTYQKLLSEKSNIVRFQSECYLFPLNARGGRSGLERIFGPYTHDLSTAPRDSSMRRAVLDHLEKDGVLISGGCLLWPEHLSQWGTQTYCNQSAP